MLHFYWDQEKFSVRCLYFITALSELSDASIGEMTSPRFSQPLRDFSVQSGHRVCLQCRITGHPIPEAKWYKDNKAIDNSPDYEVGNWPSSQFVSLCCMTEILKRLNCLEYILLSL